MTPSKFRIEQMPSGRYALWYGKDLAPICDGSSRQCEEYMDQLILDQKRDQAKTIPSYAECQPYGL